MLDDDRAELPTREAVLGQAVPFDPERWRKLLPDSGWWPGELDECPREGLWPRVDRRTVFGIAQRAESLEGRRHLLVAALVWGSGTKARSVKRRGRIFERECVAKVDKKLGDALKTLHEKGSSAAYFGFNNNDHQRIAYLGPAFFTKVLYFAGHDSRTDLRPLILDSVVSRTLRQAKAVDGTWPGYGWTTPQYTRYLEVVHEYAERRGVLPDQVEAALFARGKEKGRQKGQ
ncbi:8-oxoguanine DNA glycosylase OGG fold protein [Actinacidiphila acididurans]|uniref:Uncharacterized protein n=1 Tax=Actinacidiphila acididurans TaxID=2784346 RepID=A0ABS2TS75_9ACTN|nr:hypothetical protein [Actinacidiphila acididurans]MBM9505932.1 hypothetical protein [Actinacidiphila acididurans]